MPDAAKELKRKAALFRADAGTIDWPFAIIVLILVAFGLVMVFSASYATALYRFDDSFKFIRQQAIFADVYKRQVSQGILSFMEYIAP